MKQLTNEKQLKQDLLDIIKTCHGMLEDELNNHWIEEEEIKSCFLNATLQIKNQLQKIKSDLLAELPF